MKIQNLSIIFLIIIIPLIMILSYYLNLQQETLELQAEYDTKLAEATKEGIRAFEINTVDWSNWVSEKTRTTERSNVKASINTFITSLANNLNISGTAKEFMVNYIPAVAVTMYDGYYVYAPNYVPVSVVNDNNEQLYYNASEEILTTNSNNGTNLPAYEPKDGVKIEEATYTYVDNKNNYKKENYTFVTNINDAEMEYKHILSSQIAYVEEYSKGTNTNVVVNYTLDNRIYVYGNINGASVEKDGYLAYFDNKTVLPIIKQNAQNDSDITISKGIDEAIYSNGQVETKIEGETLEEQILYYESETYHLENFKYIYDIEHEKLYYDEDEQDFFTLSGNQRVFINNSLNPEIKYKSVSILLGDGKTTQYKKIYQALNGSDKGKWYISIKEDSIDAINQGIEEIDTEIKSTKLQELGLDSEPIYKDYSAINYYVEAYAFTNWMQDNLGDISVPVEGTPTKIFEITSTNNPEDETSPIVLHKKQVMREHIETNLNLAISNYSMGTYEYKLPEMSVEDWEQMFSNISMVTFFQGMPMGLKYYNNYAIATSTNNREYVDPEEIYFSGDNDKNYHKIYCSICGETESKYTGYRSVEYSLREYSNSDKSIYYYQHDKSKNSNSETACYYCLVNRANYNKMEAANEQYGAQTQAYNEALARERYYQKQQVMDAMFNNVTVSVIKKELTITNTDIIFILDDSGSMNAQYDNVKEACSEILGAMIGEGLRQNFYIGFIRFSSDASIITFEENGEIQYGLTNSSQKDAMEAALKDQYGDGGGTDYNVGLQEAINIITDTLKNRTNQKVIVFMTDGRDSTVDKANKTIEELKKTYGVDGFFSIGYGDNVSSIVQEWPYEFSFGTYYKASEGNLKEKFKDILYNINSSDPENTTVDDRLEITAIDISAEKPLIIRVKRKNGYNISTIQITEKPTSNQGVVILENSNKIYLDLEGLANECDLSDFKDIEVSIEYYAN